MGFKVGGGGGRGVHMLALFIILILLTASDGLCGPVLEEILNCIKLDHHTLTRDENRFCTIEPGKPVGQTFLVSDEVEKSFALRCGKRSGMSPGSPMRFS